MTKRNLFYGIMLYLGMITAMSSMADAGGGGVGSGGNRPLAEEIIPVILNVRGVGRTEIDIIYRDGKAYLPVVQMFSFLKIKAEFVPEQSIVKGFFLHPDSEFVIDGTKGTVKLGKHYTSFGASDYFITDKDIFLLSTLFQPIFGLNFVYNPRKVSVSLSTTIRLPVLTIRERERRRTRLALTKIPTPSLRQDQQRLIIGAGRLDWRLNSTLAKGTTPKGSYFARLGGQLLFGDAQIQVLQQPRKSFDKEMMHGFLRYAFLNNSLVRQVILGDVVTPGLFPLVVLGGEITNRPAPRRLFFATEPLATNIGTQQDVDVYTGAGLHSFGRSAEDGSFYTEVPLLYGVNGINVNSYDAWGQERTAQFRVIVPPNILPPGEIQYSVMGGKLRNVNYQRYGAASLGWGVNSRFTIESRIEYYDISSFTRKAFTTFNAVARITHELIGEASVTPYAISTGKLSLTLPSLVGGSLTYTRYGRNYLFNPTQAVDETEIAVALPFSLDGGFMSVRGIGRQTMFRTARERAVQLGTSVQLYSIQPTLTTTYSQYEAGGVYNDLIKRWTTTATLDARLRGNFILRLLGQYNHSFKQFEFASAQFSKTFTNQIFFQLFVERTFIVQSSVIGVRVSYYFPFARLQAVAAKPTDGLYYRQSVSGSTLFSSSTGDIYFQNYPNRVGLGALVVQPFLDLNNNGQKDEGENSISRMRIRAATQTTLKRLQRLNEEQMGTLSALPYQSYTLFLEQQRLENPLWITPFTAIEVVTEPNRVRKVNFPVVVGGIVRGVVQRQINQIQQPVENIVVRIKNVTTGYEKAVRTFATGEYEFVAVPPGSYAVFIDESSIQQFGLRPEPSSRNVEVLAKSEGDFIDNVDFILQ
jgi:hypothetical protein